MSPARPLPKRKSAADDDMGDAEAAGEDVPGEGLGAEAGEGGVEGKLVEPLDPELLQPVGARLGRHQAEGRRGGREEGARVRLEGDDAEGRAEPRGGGVGEREHRLVAEVHAVEVAHRDRGAAVVGAEPAIVVGALHASSNAHPRSAIAHARGAFKRARRRQSNLRLGASTSASPSRTARSPTRQRQSRVTRRRAWSMAVTETVASTRSPGRTGARNFRLWPR